MGNHESWRSVVEFIVSHKMKYGNCETYFAEFSEVKIPHNQNFSDFAERLLTRKNCNGKPNSTIITVSDRSDFSFQIPFLHHPHVWEVFAGQETYSSGSLYFKCTWVPCSQYVAVDEVQCQQIHYWWITKGQNTTAYSDLKTGTREANWIWFSLALVFDYVSTAITSKVSVVLHFWFMNGLVSCYLNTTLQLFWVALQG